MTKSDFPAFRNDDPHYPALLSQTAGLDPVAKSAAAMYVQAIPVAERSNSEMVSARLTGPLALTTVASAAQHGMAYATPELEASAEQVRVATSINDDLREIEQRRKNLPNEVVEFCGVTTTRSQVRVHKVHLDAVTEQRDLAGDHEHRQGPDSPWTTWLVAAVISVIEAYVTLRIFGVSADTLFSLTTLTWLALTVASVLWNHHTIAWAGRQVRDHREITKQARVISDHAWNSTHPLSGETP